MTVINMPNVHITAPAEDVLLQSQLALLLDVVRGLRASNVIDDAAVLALALRSSSMKG